MKVSLIQTDIKWGDRDSNLKNVENLILVAEKADLYVMPEMFTTGFATSPGGLVENDQHTVEWMQEMAGRTDAAMAASVAVESHGKFYNRLYFVTPKGDVTTYDKRHLFAYAGESEQYEPGKNRVVTTWRGVRILLQICYDLRFPVFSRNHNDYDLAIYVANWPENRMHVWDTLLKARAMENQCYVAGVNRIGDDENCHYVGGTKLINPYGRTVVECLYGKQQTVCAELDMEKLNAFKIKFPVLKDADEFKLVLPT